MLSMGFKPWTGLLAICTKTKTVQHIWMAEQWLSKRGLPSKAERHMQIESLLKASFGCVVEVCQKECSQGECGFELLMLCL